MKTNSKMILRRKLVAVAVASCFTVTPVFANPIGATVVNGQVGFTTQGCTLTVTNSPNAIINWQQFSIKTGEVTRFAQHSAQSAVLNRVVGQDPSQLLGSLLSNGRVYLINPNGILFGQGAVIDVGGLVASTLKLSDADFLAGRLNFTDGAGAGAIDNQGSIITPAGGNVYLIAPDITNSGVITSPQGEILLAAGHSVNLMDTANPNVQVTVGAPGTQAVNIGTLIARSGKIGIYGALIDQQGLVNADTAVVGANGKIILRATQGVTLGADSVTSANGPQGGELTITSEGGITVASGRIEAKGSQGQGGTVHVLGNQVGVMDGATVTANGMQGGGTILVGGDYQGKNPDVPNAQLTYVARTATISADAIDTGDGGKVIVWADDTTRAYGSLSARGGTLFGNGGLIETSGHRYLDVEGISINAAARSGRAGTWLLDPNDVTIVHDTGATRDSNISGTPTFIPAADTANSVISDYTLNAAINGGTSVSVTTASTGTAGSGDIKFDPSVGGAITLNKTAGTYTSLILNAWRDIRFLPGTTNLQSSASASGGMVVAFNPGSGGSGGVFTDNGATVNLRGDAPGGWGLAAQVWNGKTWQNNGTINRDSDSTILLSNRFGVTGNNSSYSTFQNNINGILNFNSGGGWSFTSDPGTQAGIVNNAGTINVNILSTAWEALFTNQTGGTLNIAAGNYLSMQNANTLSGTINIGAGSTLALSEVHGGARTFSGATINDAGTLSFGPSTATFSNTTLSYTGGTGNYTIPTGIVYSGNVSYSATGNLVLASPINTTGNVTLNADSDGVGGGNIQVTSSIITNGGNIIFGGGLNPLTTAAVGSGTATSADASGIYLDGATLNAGGGSISLRGTGAAGTTFGADGIYATNGSVIQTIGAGTITLNGTGGAGSTLNSGVRLGTNSQIASVNGAIFITGQGGVGSGVSNYGVYVHNGATVTSTGTGSIIMNGTGGAGTDDNYGVRFSSGMQINSVNGDISIIGQGVGTGIRNYGIIQTNTSGAITSTGSANIILSGTGAGTAEGINLAGAINAHHNLTLQANTLLLTAGSNYTLAAGNDLNLQANIGTSGTRFAHDLTLTAGNNVNINNSIYLGNNLLTLAANADGVGGGDVVISPPNTYWTAASIVVDTQGGLNVSGVGLQVLGHTPPPPCDCYFYDAPVTVNVGGNFTANLTGTMLIKAGAATAGSINYPVNVDNSVNLNVTGVTNIKAASLAFRGGTAVAVASSSNNYSAKADAVLHGTGTITIDTTGGATVQGGSASANGSFITATATAAAAVQSTSKLYITTTGTINLTPGTTAVIAGDYVDASARVEASPYTIYVTFPNLTSGGYFVNGVEGAISTGSLLTDSGFFTGGAPAVLNSTMFVTYLDSALTDPVLGAVNFGANTTNDSITFDSFIEPIRFGDSNEDKKNEKPVCR